MKKTLKGVQGDLLMGLVLDNPDEIGNKIRIILHQKLSMKAEVIGCETKHYISGIDNCVRDIVKLINE